MNLDRIVVTPLARVAVAGGDVLHALKKGEAGFEGFGEAYFSWATPGAVKGWKLHARMTMNLVVPVGTMQFAFVSQDGRETRTEELGERRYVRLTVPPGIWFAFRCVSGAPSLLLNVASIAHEPTEVERLPLIAFGYTWPEP